MSESHEQLRQRLLQSQQAVLEAVAHMDAERIRVLVNPGWTAQDLLAHLAAAELGHCAVVHRLLVGEDTAIPGFNTRKAPPARVAGGALACPRATRAGHP